MSHMQKELERLAEAAPVLDENSGAWSAVYAMHPNFIGFSGHFPGYPLLPAFLQVSLIRLMLNKARGRELELGRIAAAKFTGQVRPGGRLRVQCRPLERTVGPGEEGWDCALDLEDAGDSGAGARVASIRLFLKEESRED